MNQLRPRAAGSSSRPATCRAAADALVAEPSTSRGTSAGQICIVGAGPAGILAAGAFARRGMDVQVFERRDEKSVLASTSRSYTMVLSGRTLRALDALDMHASLIHGPDAVKLKALMIGRQRIPAKDAYALTKESSAVYASERQYWMASLLQAAEQLPPGAGTITWHWGCKLAHVDLQARQATIEPTGDTGVQVSSNTLTAVKYDLLVGADGSSSVVREQLEKLVPGFKTKLLYKSRTTWYKTFVGVDLSHLPTDDPALPGVAGDQPMTALYVAIGKPYEAHKPTPAVTCWKAVDHKLAGVLALMPSFDEAIVREQLSAAMPGLHETVAQQILQQVTDSRPTSNSSSIVRASQLHGPHCVLVGDAAHPVTSTFGQGCNSALESVMALLQTWDKVKDFDALPAAFNQARKPDVHALQTIDKLQLMAGRPQDFPESSPLALAMAKAVVTSSTWVHSVLKKLFPNQFPHMSPLHRMIDEQYSYSQVLRLMLAEAALAIVVMPALTMLLSALAWRMVAS